jgi:hypothetical protein
MVAGCIIVVVGDPALGGVLARSPRARRCKIYGSRHPLRARSKKLGSDAESVMRAKRRWFRSRDERRLSRRRAKWAGGQSA